MKKVGIIFSFLAMIAMVEIIQSCCKCSDDQEEINYSLCEVEVENIDNSGFEVNIDPSDPIPKEAYGIRISTNYKEGVCKKDEGFNVLLNSAHAFSCYCPPELVYNPTDSITSIEILADQQFDNSHPAMSDISDYFKVFEEDDYLDIQNYSSALYPQQPYSFHDSDTLDVLLLTPPVNPGTYQFEVHLNFESGNKIISQCQPVTLQ